jgi:DnaJ-class molecular chaperone
MGNCPNCHGTGRGLFGGPCGACKGTGNLSGASGVAFLVLFFVIMTLLVIGLVHG